MSHFPSGTELRTTVSTENIIDGPRQKGTASNKPVTKNSGNTTRISIGSPTGRFKCPCGKSFSSSWNFTQHAMACKVAKAKKVKIPQPVKIKSDTGSPAKEEPSMPSAKPVATASSSKNIEDVPSPSKNTDKSVPGSPVKRFKCHICKKMFCSSWNYAQHIKSCGTHRRKTSHTSSPSKSTRGSPAKTNSPTRSPIKPNVPKSPAKSGDSKSPSGSTCKSNKIQSESSDSDDSKSSDEEEVVIKPIYLSEKKQAKQLSSSGKKKSDNSRDSRSKSPSSSGGKEKKQNGSAEDSSAGSPPKLSEEELKRIRQIVNEDEMRCMKCHKQYCTISYLHRHAVRHLGWRRFKCKLCKYTAYNRSECTTHLRKVHSSKTMGVRDMNPYIHDLEPEKIKQELSTLTRVERPNLQRSNSNQSSNGENYNISTRRNTRVFNTKPYVRNEDDQEIENDDNPNSQKTFHSRKGADSKPDLLKRKLDTEDSEDSKGLSKRRRRDSDDDSTSSEETEIEFRRLAKNSKMDSEASEQKERNKKAPPSHGKKVDSESESESEYETDDVVVDSPSRRKPSRPHKSVNGVNVESQKRSSPVRPNIKTPSGVTKLVKQGSGTSPAKMSQKIQDLVQSDVDNILQMVQGNKVQNVQNNISSSRSDEVVILVVGENKTMSPMKTVSAASPIKISLAPKVISSPGGAMIASANIGAAAASRGAQVVTVSRSPVKILPKPVTPASGTKVNIFDKLAAKQLSQSQNTAVATIPAPVTTVTAGNRSPRRQQNVQK